jgi:hypothetical protein
MSRHRNAAPRKSRHEVGARIAGHQSNSPSPWDLIYRGMGTLGELGDSWWLRGRANEHHAEPHHDAWHVRVHACGSLIGLVAVMDDFGDLVAVRPDYVIVRPPRFL